MFEKDMGLIPRLGCDSCRPALESQGIVLRPSQPDISPTRGSDQGSTATFALIFIDGDQRNIPLVEKLVHLIIEPGLMPKFESCRPARREALQKTLQSACILRESGGQLEKSRTQ